MGLGRGCWVVGWLGGLGFRPVRRPGHRPAAGPSRDPGDNPIHDPGAFGLLHTVPASATAVRVRASGDHSKDGPNVGRTGRWVANVANRVARLPRSPPPPAHLARRPKSFEIND